MPPKKEGPSTKTQKKEIQKIVEDKTFGLKNKNKSKAVQKYVKNVSNQVAQKLGKGGESKQQQLEFQKKADQKKEEEQKTLLASLFKSVTTIKQTEAQAGEDPKSIVCAYFKAGVCKNGKKCKYSHDLDIENKSAKIDLYTDQRDVLYGNNKEEDNMQNWDEDTLKQAVEENQKKYRNQKPTEIICKYFLDAVENKKYGWFWVCPNGMGCIYKHCLPPGYVLKKDLPKIEKDDETPIEELVEEERAKLTSKSTPVTLERFLEWKEKKRLAKEAEEQKKIDEAKKHGHKGMHQLSGRALFKFDPTLFADDDDAVEGDAYDEREEEQEEQEQEEKVDRKYNLKDQEEDNNDDDDEEEEEKGDYNNEGDEYNGNGNENENEEIKEEQDEDEYRVQHEDEEEQKEEDIGQIKIQNLDDMKVEILEPKKEEDEKKGEDTTSQNQSQGVEKKKKKKNRNKNKNKQNTKETEDNTNQIGVKINENIFLDDDANLPDDIE